MNYNTTDLKLKHYNKPVQVQSSTRTAADDIAEAVFRKLRKAGLEA